MLPVWYSILLIIFIHMNKNFRYNPFECHNTADQMHLPTMSPRVFNVVQSPSSDREETTVNDQVKNKDFKDVVKWPGDRYFTELILSAKKHPPHKAAVLRTYHLFYDKALFEELQAQLFNWLTRCLETTYSLLHHPVLMRNGRCLILIHLHRNEWHSQMIEEPGKG